MSEATSTQIKSQSSRANAKAHQAPIKLDNKAHLRNNYPAWTPRSHCHQNALPQSSRLVPVPGISISTAHPTNPRPRSILTHKLKTNVDTTASRSLPNCAMTPAVGSATTPSCTSGGKDCNVAYCKDCFDFKLGILVLAINVKIVALISIFWARVREDKKIPRFVHTRHFVLRGRIWSWR